MTVIPHSVGSTRLVAACLVVFCLVVFCCFHGCYFMRGSSGGGQTAWSPPRAVQADDIALERGYTIAAVARDLTFPTGAAVDDRGRLHVVEAGYSYGEVFTTPRLLRIEPDGGATVVARGDTNGPWTGVVFHDGAFYVAEGGQLRGGRILRITPDGTVTPLLAGLPSYGDHHTNGPAIGPDGFVYFGQGTATNSGIVGVDNAMFGWLLRRPDFHDRPCRDVVLTGVNVETDNPLTPDPDDRVVTGAYSPFGTSTDEGQVVEGVLPCNGAIMRVPLRGGEPELVAWGLRNPFGLAFSPDGRLFVTENGYDDRGSRPVWGTGDVLWEITPGTWYGWPDFSAGEPLTREDFDPPGGAEPTFLLAQHPNQPPAPTAVLGVHSSSNGLDFSRSAAFGYEGQAFIAQFGDQAPDVGKVLNPVGFKVVRVDVSGGAVHDFIVNKGESNGPASRLGTGGLERPVAVHFSPDGSAMYIVDFGVMLMTEHGPVPQRSTGVVWRVTRQ